MEKSHIRDLSVNPQDRPLHGPTAITGQPFYWWKGIGVIKTIFLKVQEIIVRLVLKGVSHFLLNKCWQDTRKPEQGKSWYDEILMYLYCHELTSHS